MELPRRKAQLGVPALVRWSRALWRLGLTFGLLTSAFSPAAAQPVMDADDPVALRAPSRNDLTDPVVYIRSTVPGYSFPDPEWKQVTQGIAWWENETAGSRHFVYGGQTSLTEEQWLDPLDGSGKRATITNTFPGLTVVPIFYVTDPVLAQAYCGLLDQGPESVWSCAPNSDEPQKPANQHPLAVVLPAQTTIPWVIGAPASGGPVDLGHKPYFMSMAHEWGHVLGLAHPAASSNQNAVMVPILSRSDGTPDPVNFDHHRGLGEDDIQRIWNLYSTGFSLLETNANGLTFTKKLPYFVRSRDGGKSWVTPLQEFAVNLAVGDNSATHPVTRIAVSNNPYSSRMAVAFYASSVIHTSADGYPQYAQSLYLVNFGENGFDAAYVPFPPPAQVDCYGTPPDGGTQECGLDAWLIEKGLKSSTNHIAVAVREDGKRFLARMATPDCVEIIREFQYNGEPTNDTWPGWPPG